MKKFYHLATCSTCQKILKALDLPEGIALREIKSEPLTEAEVDGLASKAGSYEAIFSKRAMKFRQLGLHNQALTEQDFRHYLLEDYTFLKRPVLEMGSVAVAGNSKDAIAKMKSAIAGK